MSLALPQPSSELGAWASFRGGKRSGWGLQLPVYRESYRNYAMTYLQVIVDQATGDTQGKETMQNR